MEEVEIEEEMSKNFKNYEKKIKDGIVKHLKYAGILEKVSLIPGICMLPINNEVSNNIHLGKSLPMVAVIGEDSGRVYFFALKTLLPEVFEERGTTEK